MSQRLDYQDSLCYPIAVCPAHLSSSPEMIINSKIYIMRFVSLAASVLMITTTLGTPTTHPEDLGNTSSWPDGGESTAIAGKPVSFTAHAINNGNTAASKYTVVLKRNDEEVARKTSETLAADSLRSITIEDIMLPAGYNSDNVQYSLALLYDDEQYVADNTVDNIVIPVDFSTYPRPVELIASESHAGIRLKWNTPDMSQATPEPILETFEDFTSFDTKGSKGWKFLDMDHGLNSSLQGTTLPGITSQATGFFVLDRSFGPMANNNTFSAVSGKKYLSQFEAYPSGSNQPVVCNDWAILPEFFGTSQTIRFYARSYNPNYLESFEFMTSSSNADPTSFTALKRYESIPATWTLYEIAVPAGTRYAAIRCFSQGKMMMHVDDVEFIPAGEANLHLSGYNVWMDNKCVNTELITRQSVRGTCSG